MSWVWLVWALATLAVFLAVEIYALVTNPRWTLTVTFRRVLGLQPWKWYGAVARLVLVAFCAWLVIHLGFGYLP